MSFSIRCSKKESIHRVVSLRNCLTATIQGITLRADSIEGGTVELYLDPRMKEMASGLFKAAKFVLIQEGIDKIAFPWPNAANIDEFIKAFKAIEPLDEESEQTLRKHLLAKPKKHIDGNEKNASNIQPGDVKNNSPETKDKSKE